MLSVNPSQRELMHVINKVTGKTNVNEFSELSKDEQENVICELKNYARHCMDEYAVTFIETKLRVEMTLSGMVV